MRVLLAANDHPCKQELRDQMRHEQSAGKFTGLRRIAQLLRDIFRDGPGMEDPTKQDLALMTEPSVAITTKEVEGRNHAI